MKHVCPDRGAIYADKGYCTKPAKEEAHKKRCHLAAILKNNIKGKNKDKDRWHSGIRSPYERIFSRNRKRTRFRGIAKNQFAAFMEALCFNLRRLTKLNISLCLN